MTGVPVLLAQAPSHAEADALASIPSLAAVLGRLRDHGRPVERAGARGETVIAAVRTRTMEAALVDDRTRGRRLVLTPADKARPVLRLSTPTRGGTRPRNHDDEPLDGGHAELAVHLRSWARIAATVVPGDPALPPRTLGDHDLLDRLLRACATDADIDVADVAPGMLTIMHPSPWAPLDAIAFRPTGLGFVLWRRDALDAIALACGLVPTARLGADARAMPTTAGGRSRIAADVALGTATRRTGLAAGEALATLRDLALLPPFGRGGPLARAFAMDGPLDDPRFVPPCVH